MAYNEANGITPRSIVKKVGEVIEIGKKPKGDGSAKRKLSGAEREKLIAELTREMKEASRMLEFEKAAYLRDRIKDLRTTK